VFGTALAQLSVASSVALGFALPCWALDHLVGAALATQREFGAFERDALDGLSGPVLGSTRSDVQLRRFRAQAERAVHDTIYCVRLFVRIGLEP
jgi:hypothetical protein